MARRGATAKGEAALTRRKREWFRRLRACASRGQTMRSYAKQHGISEHSLYQPAKELRGLGVLMPASTHPGSFASLLQRHGFACSVKEDSSRRTLDRVVPIHTVSRTIGPNAG